MEVKTEEIVRSMPKLELHAHLNGSISEKLLEHIKVYNGSIDPAEELLPNVDDVLLKCSGLPSPLDVGCMSAKEKSLHECWKAFGKIHEVIRTPAALYIATVNVIAEFSRDNVIYLELRTGPKKIHKIPSKLSYIETVVKGIQDGVTRFPIVVKLLISVDRKNGEQDALETVELATVAKKKYPHVIVGIDISGDPNFGHADWIVRIMSEARSRGIKISCHLPEIVNPEEAMTFLMFGPERVGHGQYLHPLYGGTLELWELTKEKRIPVESCISSNLISGVATAVDDHVVKVFQKESIPYIICTDDCGVFDTTLSDEFMKLLSVVQLSFQEIKFMCLDTVNYAFSEDDEKRTLKNIINDWWEEKFPTISAVTVE